MPIIYLKMAFFITEAENAVCTGFNPNLMQI